MLSSKEFADRFDLYENGFSEQSLFIDGVIGFSVRKDRTQNDRGFASLYKFYIDPKKSETSDGKKIINVSVAYGERVEDYISLTPEGLKKKDSWPIDFTSATEYFYDDSSQTFFYKSKKSTATNLLLKAEKLHLRPTKLVVGFPIRSKLFWYRTFPIVVSNLVYYILIGLLYVLSGTKTKTNILFIGRKGSELFKDADKIAKEEFASEKINIFGYAASAWSVVLYSLIHLVLYYFWFMGWRSEDFSFITTILKNAFLTICYVIPSLVLFERLIPTLIEKAIREMGNIYRYFAFRQLKI